MDTIVTAVRVRDRVVDGAMHHGHRFTTESRAPDLDEAAGPAPMEMLLAGLAACAVGTFAGLLEKMRLEFEAVAVRVAAERAEDYPKVWATIHYTVEVRGAVPDDRARRALELTERTCPASVMLGKAAAVTAAVEVVPV